MTHPTKLTATCLHCGSVCVAMRAGDVYRAAHAAWADKTLHVCPFCPDSRVGSHPGTDEPLGFAADGPTRQARMRLHQDMLDPIWKAAPRHEQKAARTLVYQYLSHVMGLPEAHVGEFTIEQCREAWQALSNETLEGIEFFMQEVAA